MTARAPFHEPAYSFIFRKYFEYLLASVALVVLLLVDVEIANGASARPEAPYVISSGVAVGVALLVLLGHRKASLRRYRASNAAVTLPVATAPGISLPDELPVERLLGMYLEPAEGCLDAPVLVKLIIGRADLDGPAATVLTTARDFGLGNLKDLVLRLPPDRIQSSFGRVWQERVAYEEMKVQTL